MAELYKYQKTCIEKLLNGKHIICAGMGMGKNPMSVVWAVEKCEETGKDKILVVTTASKSKTTDHWDDLCKFCAGKENSLSSFSVISWHKLKAWVEEHTQELDEWVVIFDECLAGNTKVETLDGEKEIADLKIGDEVVSYNHAKNILEYKKVTRLIKKEAPQKMWNLHLSNGTAIISTGNHPHYTQDGYKNAEDINIGDMLYENIGMENSKIWGKRGVWNLWKKNNDKRHNTRPTRQTTPKKENLLLPEMHKESFKREWQESDGKAGVKRKTKAKSDCQDDNQQPIKGRTDKAENVKNERSEWVAANMGKKTGVKRWQWKIFRTAKNLVEKVKRGKQGMGNGTASFAVAETTGVPKQLQARHRKHLLQDRDRVRRRESQFNQDKNKRQEKREKIRGVRVESIEILELRDIKRRRLYRDADYVYCIDVEDNHNFFANGVLTHNCQRSKGYSTGMGKAFLKITKTNDDWAGFTGTPGDTWDAFISYFVATKKTTCKTHFLNRYANIQTYKGYPEIVSWRYENELRNMWADISYAPDTSIVAKQLPKEKYETVTMSKPKGYAKVLKTRENENGEFLDTSGALVAELRRICFTKDKQQWMSDFVEGVESGAVIFYNYIATGDKLEEIIKKALPKGARLWRIDGKHHEIPTAKTIGKKDMVLCQWQSGSEALNLQFLHYWVGAELCYSYSTFMQSIGRIKRIGQTMPMTFYLLVTDGTIEQDVLKCLRGKREFSERNWCINNKLIEEEK